MLPPAVGKRIGSWPAFVMISASSSEREDQARSGPADTTAPCDFHDLGVLQSGGGIRSFTHNRVALRLDVTLDERFHGFGWFLAERDEIDRGARLRLNGVRCVRADVTRLDARTFKAGSINNSLRGFASPSVVAIWNSRRSAGSTSGILASAARSDSVGGFRPS